MLVCCICIDILVVGLWLLLIAVYSLLDYLVLGVYCVLNACGGGDFLVCLVDFGVCGHLLGC